MTQQEFDVVSEVRIMKKLLEGHLVGAWQRNLTIWGIILTIVIQVVSFAYMYGQLTQRVYAGEKAIERIERGIDKSSEQRQYGNHP